MTPTWVKTYGTRDDLIAETGPVLRDGLQRDEQALYDRARATALEIVATIPQRDIRVTLQRRDSETPSAVVLVENVLLPGEDEPVMITETVL